MGTILVPAKFYLVGLSSHIGDVDLNQEITGSLSMIVMLFLKRHKKTHIEHIYGGVVLFLLQKTFTSVSSDTLSTADTGNMTTRNPSVSAFD